MATPVWLPYILVGTGLGVLMIVVDEYDRTRPQKVDQSYRQSKAYRQGVRSAKRKLRRLGKGPSAKMLRSAR